jgi:hypothetical protein
MMYFTLFLIRNFGDGLQQGSGCASRRSSATRTTTFTFAPGAWRTGGFHLPGHGTIVLADHDTYCSSRG